MQSNYHSSAPAVAIVDVPIGNTKDTIAYVNNIPLIIENLLLIAHRYESRRLMVFYAIYALLDTASPVSFI